MMRSPPWIAIELVSASFRRAMSALGPAGRIESSPWPTPVRATEFAGAAGRIESSAPRAAHRARWHLAGSRRGECDGEECNELGTKSRKSTHSTGSHASRTLVNRSRGRGLCGHYSDESERAAAAPSAGLPHLPVFTTPRGSQRSNCTSCSADGQCKTPRGTTNISSGPSSTTRSRMAMRNRPREHEEEFVRVRMVVPNEVAFDLQRL